MIILNRSFFRFLLAISLYFGSISLGLAQTTVPIPDPPELAAKGYLLIDFHSNRILASENADERLEPASLTKIMTAYVVFHEIKQGHIKLDDLVSVSRKAWQTGGSKMFIEVGKEIPLGDLLKGMIIQSGNDASVALAEHVAGSEQSFAGLMNSHAKRLGMHHSHFVNSTGLPDPDHYTTASDIVRVTRATIHDFPDFYAWYSIKEFSYNNIKQHNRNRLLWRDSSVDGVKTGHTEAAGYCLVASAVRDKMRLISVVMGSGSEEARARQSRELLNYGFRFYESHPLYAKAKSLNQARVWKGSTTELSLGLAEDFYVTIPRHQYQNLEAQLTVNPRIVAPVTAGTVYGEIQVTLSGQPIAKVDLVALHDVPRGSLWRRLIDAIMMWFL